MAKGYIWRPFLFEFREYLGYTGWTFFESDAQVFTEQDWKDEYQQYGFQPIEDNEDIQPIIPFVN